MSSNRPGDSEPVVSVSVSRLAYLTYMQRSLACSSCTHKFVAREQPVEDKVEEL
jgi:hypothetical protein